MQPLRVVVVALSLVTLAALALPPRPARADAQQTQSFQIWRQMQDCAKLANKQFPDHTVEGNAKREAARQECLRVRRLPVSAPAPNPPR